MEKIKIACALTTHQRPIVKETVDVLKSQKDIDIKIVLAYSDDRDAVNGCINIKVLNKPLAYKRQVAINECRKLQPDYLLWMDSNKWISEDWCLFFANSMKQGSYDVGGSGVVYNIRCLPKNPLKLIKSDLYYGTPRYGEPLGPGRMFSATFLDKIDWVLHPDLTLDWGCDGSNWKKMVEVKAKVFFWADSPPAMLQIKGDWNQLEPWWKLEKILKEKTWKCSFELDPYIWLNKYFPNKIKYLEELVR